jgi:hypothetical protein
MASREGLTIAKINITCLHVPVGIFEHAEPTV